MRRFVVCLFVALFVFSVPAFAWIPTHTWREGDVTLIGVFKVKGTASESFYRGWMLSQRNICARISASDGDGYIFFDVPADASLSLSVQSNGITLKNTGFKTVSGHMFKYQGGEYQITGIGSIGAGTSWTLQGLVVSTYFVDPPPVTNYNYWPELSGMYGLRDDLDEEPPLPPDKDDGILDWLGKFWDKLKDFLIGIFVPDADYFDKWFETIRAAFDKKAGGLGTVFDKLQSGLGSLGSGNLPSLRIGVGAGAFYSGSKGIDVDLVPYLDPVLRVVRPVITSFVLILTAIACYRHLVSVIGK